jgi:hypothetical protein
MGFEERAEAAADEINHAAERPECDDEGREEEDAGDEGVADRDETGDGRRSVGHGWWTLRSADGMARKI